jgi:hypothetical protein
MDSINEVVVGLPSCLVINFLGSMTLWAFTHPTKSTGIKAHCNGGKGYFHNRQCLIIFLTNNEKKKNPKTN